MDSKTRVFASFALLFLATATYTHGETRLKTIHEAIKPITKKLNLPASKSLEDEIVDSVSSQLPNLKVDPAVTSILHYVVETRKVPGDAKVSFLSNDVLCLDLCLTENAEAKTGYRLILRHPALRRLDDGTLRLSEKWKPSEHEIWTWNGRDWQVTTK